MTRVQRAGVVSWRMIRWRMMLWDMQVEGKADRVGRPSAAPRAQPAPHRRRSACVEACRYPSTPPAIRRKPCWRIRPTPRADTCRGQHVRTASPGRWVCTCRTLRGRAGVEVGQRATSPGIAMAQARGNHWAKRPYARTTAADHKDMHPCPACHRQPRVSIACAVQPTPSARSRVSCHNVRLSLRPAPACPPLPQSAKASQQPAEVRLSCGYPRHSHACVTV